MKLLTRNTIQKINWQKESNKPNKLKKALLKSLATPPKRPESNFNYKSVVEKLEVDTPRLGRILRRYAFAPSENKTLCQQASFMRCCNLLKTIFVRTLYHN